MVSMQAQRIQTTARVFPHRGLIRALGWSAACGLLLAAGLVAARESSDKPSAPETGADAAREPKGIADLKVLEGRIQRTVAKVSPAVVSVSGGSGVVVSEDGYVLTVAHVGQRAGRKVVVIFPDGRQAKAVTLGNDQGIDAGMVKITDNGPWPHAEMGLSGDLMPGQWCLTLGYPVTFERGKPPVVRIGRVLRNGNKEIITDCTIMGGDSGGPLLNLDGKVIAIGTKCDNSLVYNIHVPIDRYRDGWEQLVKGEDFNSLAPKPALLGVVAADGAGEARIGSIVPGSGAERAGLKPDDVLLKFGGQELHKYDDLPPLVQQHKPGDKVEIELRRGTAVLKIQATMGQSNAGKDE
jgi:serine protease Do